MLPFSVGDWVSKRTYHKGSKGKLFIARIGPYEILEIKPNGITFVMQHLKKHNIETINGKHLCYYRKKIDREAIKQEQLQFINGNFRIINTIWNATLDSKFRH
eukprot:66835_1